MIHYHREVNGNRLFIYKSSVTHLDRIADTAYNELAREEELELLMARKRRAQTVTQKFVFKDTESQESREEMVKQLRTLLEKLREPDSELKFKKLTIRYTDGAVDEYEACEKPCLIMQELAE